MPSAAKLADGIDWFIDLVGRITSWFTLVLALVMGANVLLRYGFSLGWIWAQELEWHLLVPIVLFGMSYALRHGEHVRVDILFVTFSPRTRLAIESQMMIAEIAIPRSAERKSTRALLSALKRP